LLHPYLEGAFESLSGCDVSEESICRAAQDNPRIDYRRCTSPGLPYEDGAFDLAFASCVVHHVPPTSWLDFFREMRRVVRRGGVVCLVEQNPYKPLTRLAVFRCPFDEDAVLLDSRKAASLFQDTGYRDIRSEHFLLLPSTKPLARKIERVLAHLPLGAQYACSARA
jgi:SAM-dependent methyltransferase